MLVGRDYNDVTKRAMSLLNEKELSFELIEVSLLLLPTIIGMFQVSLLLPNNMNKGLSDHTNYSYF